MLFTDNYPIACFSNKLTLIGKEIFIETANYVSLPTDSDSNNIMIEGSISLCSKNLFL